MRSTSLFFLLALTALIPAQAHAQTQAQAQATPPASGPALKFDTVQLCQWQHDNNDMEIAECTTLENDAQKTISDLEAQADAKRRDECVAFTQEQSGESGFASYTVYSGCLKDGPLLAE